jgi:peptidoglycan/LPS O-acetylase OafA/YrhL
MGILLWLYKEKRLTWPGWTAMSVALVLAFFEIGNRAFEIAPILWSYGGNLRNSSLALESYAAFLIAFCAMVLSVRFNAGHVFTEGIYKVVRKLGLTTYPFYLLHEVVGGVVMYQVHKWGYSYLAGALAALLVVGVVSSLVALYCEPRLRNFIKRLLAGLNVAVS